MRGRGAVGGFPNRGGRLPHKRQVRSQSLDGFRPGKPVNGYWVQTLGPRLGSEGTALRPMVSFRGQSWDAGSMSYEVVFSTQATFGALLLSMSGSCGHLADVQVTPSIDLPRKTVYWRVRVGREGLWSEWASGWFLITASTLVCAAYVDMNVGYGPPPGDAVAYVDMNVGPAWQAWVAASYADLNLGPAFDRLETASYADLNVGPAWQYADSGTYVDVNVTGDDPVPSIWWIRPAWGKSGWVFHLFGHGFGDFKEEFDGNVLVGERVAEISVWERVPATGGAPEIVQGPTEADEVLTVEHGHIVVVVPSGLASGEKPVKVVLG